MPRTITKERNSLLIDEGGVEIPEVRDGNYSVTLLLRVGTTTTTGLHWHERKTENLQVLQGHAFITVGNHTAVYGPEDGVIVVPPYTLHELGRADAYPLGSPSKNVDLRIKEWTDPPDRSKEVFFRNELGLLLDHRPGLLGNVKTLVSAFVVMEAHDNWPVFWRGPSFMGEAVQLSIRRAVTRIVRGGIAGVGRLFGLKGTYEEYTPDELLHVSANRNRKGM